MRFSSIQCSSIQLSQRQPLLKHFSIHLLHLSFIHSLLCLLFLLPFPTFFQHPGLFFMSISCFIYSISTLLLLFHPCLIHSALQVQTRLKKRWTTFSPSLSVRTSQKTRRSTRTPPALQTPTTFSLSLTLLPMSLLPTTCASVDCTNSQDM